MPILTDVGKWIAGVLALVVLLTVLGFGWYLDRTLTKLAVAEAAVTRLEGEVEVQTLLVTAGASAARVHGQQTKLAKQQHTKDQHALSAALARNPDWASADVPSDVAASLGVQPIPPAR